MIVFMCHVCRASLSAGEADAGNLQRCPKCKTTLRVPAAAGAQVGARTTAPAEMETSPPSRPAPPKIRFPSTMTAAASGRFASQRYGFNCPYCSSKLEATGAMAAQEGQCPTCGNQITIPILNRHGQLIDPKTQEIIKQDPHPVHAYAAAGERAPQIIRTNSGVQMIVCPRCHANSPISANNCRSCNMPFTMEGTTIEPGGQTSGYAVTSLVLGVISLPAYVLVLPALGAIAFGIIALTRMARGEGAMGGRGVAIAGLVTGGIGLLIGVMSHI
jgi:Zn-finger nucleic acid-binding protein